MPVPNRFLSSHFTLHEMLISETATRYNFTEQFDPPKQVIKNLEALCLNVLEPLRMTINKPIRINSGYRCRRVNTLVGGASSSQHILGQAADIVVLDPTMSVEELFQRIRATSLPFDQVIQEFSSWVHISLRPNPRGSVLRATKTASGKTVFTKIDLGPALITKPVS